MLNEIRFTKEAEMAKLGIHHWWGRLRTRLDSPFLPQVMPKYLAEIDRIRSRTAVKRKMETGTRKRGTEEKKVGEAQEEVDGEETWERSI